MDLRKHTEHKPKTEMDRRMQYEFDYLKYCSGRNMSPDYERVMTGIINAYASGIITGTCPPGYDFDLNLPDMKLNDNQFRMLVEALLQKGLNRDVNPANMTIKVAANTLTDESLFILGKNLNHKRFPEFITFDLSAATHFTNAGAKALLDALRRDTCNLSVGIIMPNNPRNIDTQLLEQINAQLQENITNYKSVEKVAQKPAKKKLAVKKHLDTKPLIKKKPVKEKKVEKKAAAKPAKQRLFSGSKEKKATNKETSKKETPKKSGLKK